MPWLLLIVSLIGAWVTFIAYIPQRRTGPLVVPSFFAGWLTSELSAHHFAWQLAATIFFIWAGALRAWPGWLGLGITLASWLGLLALGRIAQRAAPVVETALQDALGPGYTERILPEVAERLAAPDPPGRQLVPFLLYDRGVQVTRGIQYAPGAGRRHQLDVYAPRLGVREAPVLLQIHGGGWVIGDKREQALPLMNYLAARGWVLSLIHI